MVLSEACSSRIRERKRKLHPDVALEASSSQLAVNPPHDQEPMTPPDTSLTQVSKAVALSTPSSPTLRVQQSPSNRTKDLARVKRRKLTQKSLVMSTSTRQASHEENIPDGRDRQLPLDMKCTAVKCGFQGPEVYFKDVKQQKTRDRCVGCRALQSARRRYRKNYGATADYVPEELMEYMKTTMRMWAITHKVYATMNARQDSISQMANDKVEGMVEHRITGPSTGRKRTTRGSHTAIAKHTDYNELADHQHNAPTASSVRAVSIDSVLGNVPPQPISRFHNGQIIPETEEPEERRAAVDKARHDRVISHFGDDGLRRMIEEAEAQTAEEHDSPIPSTARDVSARTVSARTSTQGRPSVEPEQPPAAGTQPGSSDEVPVPSIEEDDDDFDEELYRNPIAQPHPPSSNPPRELNQEAEEALTCGDAARIFRILAGGLEALGPQRLAPRRAILEVMGSDLTTAGAC